MSDYQKLQHVFGPLYDADSQILILGSFPSVKSREQKFFYGHPQNRFWKVISGLLHCPLPATIDEKKEMLLCHHIAVWDVIAECEIIGSSDSTIRNVVPNDLSRILQEADIRQIFTNGATSGKLYDRFQKKELHRDAICLPSTSPANAQFSIDRLKEHWQIITEYLG